MIQRAYLQPSVTRFNEPIEQAFRAVITPYLEYYTQSDPAFIEDIASRERSREFCEEASETLDVWLNRVMTS